MSHTTTFRVDGMTCGHCVSSVTEELTALPGVEDVQVELVTGGASPVTVTSQGPLDDAAVSAAVAEAGYAVTPPRSLL
ncbi:MULTISPECIES: heavy-metal-associated domain-containing protein [Cellulomonas]|uniref:Copper chaperone CopZ n=1 Tax=Cellulomonas oligotrophica TaxID=931536 RepID=A0A7Y9FFS5_9CELL|nr:MULTISPECIES: heavy-metal-associated domain-containing protein [Cellulomonas]NYD86444.1 copper chaperone CopZ [Cellulomonas oligotrophica]TQL02427.1 copper chaperone CopZ [Cellulomonas sp. SLBN-39]GIG32665.1 putative metal-binding protein [Cellulomonas oligotrophica]